MKKIKYVYGHFENGKPVIDHEADISLLEKKEAKQLAKAIKEGIKNYVSKRRT